MAVTWPQRRSQAIPANGERIDVAAFVRGGVLPLRQASLTRKGGILTSTADLSPVPAGEITLTASAKDESGTLLATAASTVSIRPNEIVMARMALVPANKPLITAVTPTNGVPGTTITIFGGAFGQASEYPIDVLIGSGSVAAAEVTRLGEGMLTFRIPEGAPSGPVVVRVAGATATSSTTLSVIASLSLTPEATTSFAPHGLVELKLEARDAAGRIVPAPAVPFDVAGKSRCPASCVGGDSLRVEGGLGELNIGAEPGRIVVEAGSGSVKASAIVDVHALGRADLPPGMGPLPAIVPAPADNAITPARAALGKTLFFEPKLSRSGAMSCATCHDPGKGFGDGRRFALGNDGKNLPRNTPTLFNVGFLSSFFWDGRASSLEAQVLGVVHGAREFDSDVPAMLAYLAASASYAAAFQEAYEATPSLALVQKAIASYERTLVSPPDTAPFDRWAKGDDTALSAAAFRGMGLFLGKARCVACHTGPAFTDGEFHNVAVEGSGTLDLGRLAVTGNPGDSGAFKTPSLRNVELTAPYFHDGSRETLDDATRHYEIFRRDFPNPSPKLKTLFLLGTDRADLLDFQRALTATASY